MMQDISDDELRQIERSSKQSINDSNVSDNQLIELVKKIKNGDTSNSTTQLVQPKIVEPEEVPRNFYNQLTQTDQNTNYWKISGLPSKGKFYPTGTEIQGRPLKVLEIKKISSMNDQNGDFILNDIIRKVIIGIDFNEIYVADKLFLIFWERANTYRESGYVVPFTCNKCGKQSNYHFEIDKLEIQEIGDDFDPTKEIKIGSDVITYDYLKIKDELYIERFRELNSKSVGEIDAELLAMAQMVKTVNGKEVSLMQKYYWIINMNPGDYAYLKTYMEKNGMGIKPYVNVSCQECGGTAPVAVSFREDFFIPEYKFE